MFKVFKRTTAETLVVDDIEEAKQKLLQHEHQSAYHSKMVDFYRASLKRLEGYAETGVK